MSSSGDETDTTTPLSAFDEGDIVVRSCDNKDFLMYKLDLSRASPVFKTMLSLPQPVTPPSQANTDDSLPVVELAESGAVLAPLLTLCTPTQQVADKFDRLEDVAHIMEAAKKYEMEWLVSLARNALRTLADTEALHVYSVACRLGLQAEATLAARACLRLPMKTILTCDAKHLDLVSGTQIIRLMNYRDECQKGVTLYLQAKVFRTCDDVGRVIICNSSCGHQSAWKKRYVAKLASILKDCIWEGAVRAEHAFAAHLQPTSNEMCKSHYCLTIDQSLLGTLHERVTSDIADVISQVPFVF